MRDGHTRKLEVGDLDTSFEEFSGQWRATVVVISGAAAGTEYEIDAPQVSIGRGPEASWRFDDDTLSKEHAALEFAGGGLRLRDLGSRNGTRLNGAEVMTGDLKNGDRFQLGELVFQFVLEQRPRRPRTYVIPDA